MHPYSHRSAHGSQSNLSLDDWQAESAYSQEHLASPPNQTRSETQSHSEADFYASAVEGLDVETEGSTSDYNSDNSPFASVLDSFPLPTRSVTSTTSSVSGPSASPSGLGTAGGHTMTKQRWGLKLQVQQLQGTRGGPGGGIGYAGPLHGVGKGNVATTSGASSSSLNLIGQQQPGSMSEPLDFPVASSSMAATADMEASDVYKHQPGYNYAFAVKPLSPIAEQDYMSPSPHSSREENRSFRFRRRSGSVKEKGNGLNTSSEKKRNKEEVQGDGDDRVSVRTGSVGSATGIVMSRAGSGSAADGAGIHKLGNAPDGHRKYKHLLFIFWKLILEERPLHHPPIESDNFSNIFQVMDGVCCRATYINANSDTDYLKRTAKSQDRRTSS